MTTSTTTSRAARIMAFAAALALLMMLVPRLAWAADDQSDDSQQGRASSVQLTPTSEGTIVSVGTPVSYKVGYDQVPHPAPSTEVTPAPSGGNSGTLAITGDMVAGALLGLAAIAFAVALVVGVARSRRTAQAHGAA